MEELISLVIMFSDTISAEQKLHCVPYPCERAISTFVFGSYDNLFLKVNGVNKAHVNHFISSK
jgi:hypothetical protein